MDQDEFATFNLVLEVVGISAIVLIVTGIVAFAALRSYLFFAMLSRQTDAKSRQAARELMEQSTVTRRMALLIPIFASAALLTLFVFKFVQNLLVLYMLFSSTAALAFLFSPLFKPAGGNGGIAAVGSSVCRLIKQYAWPVAIGSALALTWGWTNNAALSNIIGVALVVMLVSVVRLPSVKIAALVLGGLFFYDIFFVFISPLIFSENVMVSVATQQAENPTQVAVQAVEAVLPVQVPQAMRPALRLDPPNKLLFPLPQYYRLNSGDAVLFWHMSMLGLGDLALPGMLIAFSLAVQKHMLTPTTGAPSTSTAERRGTSFSLFSFLFDRLIPVRRVWREVFPSDDLVAGAPPLLFRTTIVGYAAGLAVTFFVGRVFQAAMPALLFLVPSTLFPLVLQARRSTTCWPLVWGGLPLPAALASGTGESDAETEKGPGAAAFPQVAVVVPSVADEDEKSSLQRRS